MEIGAVDWWLMQCEFSARGCLLRIAQAEKGIPDLPKTLNELGGVGGSKFSGFISQLRQPIHQTFPGRCVVPIFFSSFVEQFLSHLLQLLFHHPIAGKVHLFELIDKPHQPIQGFLVNTCLRIVDRGEHFFAECRGLGPLQMRRNRSFMKINHRFVVLTSPWTYWAGKRGGNPLLPGDNFWS